MVSGMFMYTFRQRADLTDLASALGPGDEDALKQVEAFLRGCNSTVATLRLSDDPQSAYYFEKRRAIPSPHGPGWTNDPHGGVEIIPVSYNDP